MDGGAGYDHVQGGWWHWLILAAAAAAMAGAVAADDPAARAALGLAATLMTLAAMTFARMRVRDDGDALVIAFGPLPLLRRRIPYREVTGAERGRSLLLEGWGVHFLPGRGWTWNLWGRDTVVVHLGDRTLRIGTDDPDGLLQLLHGHLSAPR